MRLLQRDDYKGAVSALEHFFMRNIRLSGREIAVLRAIGYSEAMPGPDIAKGSNISEEDVIDVLSGLMDLGYVESIPFMEKMVPGKFTETRFEVNPSYVQQLREAMIKRY